MRRRADIKIVNRCAAVIFGVIIAVILARDVITPIIRGRNPQRPASPNNLNLHFAHSAYVQQKVVGSQNVQKEPQYMYIEASKLRNYQGIIKVKSGEQLHLLTLPDTGYHTLSLHGEDLTAGLRGNTRLQFTYTDGTSQYSWDFVNKIDLEFRDVFARKGTAIHVKYNASAGYITYMGMNVTAKLKRSLLHFWK